MGKGRKRTFRQELLMCMITASVLPLAVCSLFLIQLFQMKISGDYRVMDMELAEEVNGRLELLFSKFEELTGKFCGDGEIAEALRQSDSGNSGEVYRTLYRETKELRDYAWFELYGMDGTCRYSTGTGTYQRRMEPYWGILRKAAEEEGRLVVLRADDPSGDAVLQAARLISDEQGNAGFFVINMGLQEFETALKGTYGGQDGICILDSFLETVYDAGSAAGENLGEVLRERLLRNEPIQADCNGNSIYMDKSEKTGLYTVLLRPQVFTANTVNSMYSVLFIMIAVLFAACTLLVINLSNRLSRPIHVLNRTMHEVQVGNLDTRMQEDWPTTEFAEMSGNFNFMTADLKKYMENQVEQQKQMNEIQIAMMQAQLNPHFLYNTLDTVKWVAKANHVPEIVTLVSKLAKILRAAISKEQFTTLRGEMELVESYAEIQRIRFDGRFECVCNYDEKLADCELPKLVIQPIVENAVIHGLSECEDGHIQVDAFAGGTDRDSVLVVEVRDDGCGIGQEVIDRLNNGGLQERTGHIGLGNVDKIIRLNYGEAYGVKICRPKQGGTLVTLTFPLRKERTADAENTGGR
ncbi:MAG: sensor histidine kinase [Lachnospiraceae bacterium]|nr:sensor histidine kinase [Lachnospiraceae bacterium]